MFVIDVEVMFNLQATSTTMKLLPLVSLFLLSWSGTTFGDQHEPEVIKVNEGSDVTLPCSLSTKEDIEFKLFGWRKDGQKEVFYYDGGIHSNNGRPGQDEQFKGRVSHFPDELKNGDASLKIRNTTVTDSGDYTCAFPRLQPSQIFHIQLVVVEPEVIKVEEGSDVTLPCSLSTKENIEFNRFDWRKDEGQKEVFYYDGGLHSNNGRPGQDEQFKGRVSHFSDELKNGDASLIITNTAVTDSGNYTCAFPNLQPSQTFHIQLVVVEPAVINVVVAEGSDAILPCSLRTEENIENMVFDWKKRGQKDEGQKEVFFYDAGEHYNKGRTGQDVQFKGRVFHFKEELKNGNASIKVQRTKMADSGDYTCIIPHKQTSHITLVVGAAPRPYVTILKTENGSLLQCEVNDASPKPQLQWQDSSGNILPAEEPQVTERGGRYDIILQATVTKTDNFRCVVTQEDIKHQIYADIYAQINESSTESSTGWIVAAVLGALFVAVVVLLLVLVSKGVITVNCNRGSSRDRRDQSAGNASELLAKQP